VFLNVFYVTFICILPRTGKHVFKTMVKSISADQDERQPCFFADQKQFPADR
jgi:hypothetical protein